MGPVPHDKPLTQRLPVAQKRLKAMIPTSARSTISSLLSWPVGAKEMSDAWADVPQIGALFISFLDADRNPHQRTSPHRLLSAAYRHLETSGHRKQKLYGPRVIVGHFGEEPRWEIDVSAVPRTLRHTVNAALKAEGFGRVRAWLVDHADVAGRLGQVGIGVSYDDGAGALIYREWETLL